jgi:hypothetical protein
VRNSPLTRNSILENTMKAPALKKAPSQELAVVDDENTLPDFMREDIGKQYGMETLDATDMALPRLLLMQGLSKQKEQFSFLKTGDFFHTAQEVVIPQPFLAVPIMIDKRFLLWRPRNAGGGILARANDAKHWQPSPASFTVTLDKKDGGATVTWETKETVAESGLAEWGSMDPDNPESPPAATLTYNILLAFPANPELSPAVLSLQRTGMKAALDLNMKLKSLNRPSFQSVIQFSSFLDHKGTNDFYSVKTVLAGFLCAKKKWRADDAESWTLGDLETYQNYKALYERLAKSGLDIKDEDELQSEVLDAQNSDDNGVPFHKM